MAFQFDTSGCVYPTGRTDGPFYFGELTPFAQGYIEGLFASGPVSDRERLSFVEHGYGFKHLHPEALALVISDCDALTEDYPGIRVAREAGRDFWLARNHPEGLPRWEPLHPFLSDDGRVCLRPASEAQSEAT